MAEFIKREDAIRVIVENSRKAVTEFPQSIDKLAVLTSEIIYELQHLKSVEVENE